MRASVIALLYGAIALLCGAIACGGQPAGVRDITQQELLANPQGATILDVRTPEEFSSGHVPGAVNIPHTELAARMSELDERRDTVQGL